jgi:hypothetical protein
MQGQQSIRLAAICVLHTPQKTVLPLVTINVRQSENGRFVSAFYQALHLSHHPYPGMTILYTRAGKVTPAR